MVFNVSFSFLAHGEGPMREKETNQLFVTKFELSPKFKVSINLNELVLQIDGLPCVAMTINKL